MNYDFFLILFSREFGSDFGTPSKAEDKGLFGSQPPKLHRIPSHAPKIVPVASPKSVVEVDGFEASVERTPMYYEKIEDIFDELPEFAQEIIASHYLQGHK
jgi:hypothetical protein